MWLLDLEAVVDALGNAVARHARNWRALVSHLHHTVEPYYVIAAVASLAIGSISYLIARFG